MKTSASILLIVLGFALLGCADRQKQAQEGEHKAPISAAAAKGREIFYERCAVCHEAKQGTPGAGPALKGLFQRPAHSLADGTEIAGGEQSIREFIVHGDSNMPPIGAALSPQELDEVLAYLHTL